MVPYGALWSVPKHANEREARIMYPVIYAPNGFIIGAAATERGAIGHAARIPKLACERWTASLKERLDGSLAWFVGLQLVR
jgi:hypothetical protein